MKVYSLTKTFSLAPAHYFNIGRNSYADTNEVVWGIIMIPQLITRLGKDFERQGLHTGTNIPGETT